MKSTANQCTMSGARVGISGAERQSKEAHCAYCGRALKIRPALNASHATLPNHNKPEVKV